MTSGEPVCVFLDTNVLAYALLTRDPRHKIADELLSLGGLVSVQVLNEFISVARRKYHFSWPAIREKLGLIRLLCGPAIATDQRTHDRAIDIAENHAFHIYDATILASALDAACTVLYSEDMQDGQRIEGLTIRNPFSGLAPGLPL